MKNKNYPAGYIKAARKGSREAEIEMYGKPLPKLKVHKSKKAYARNKAKAAFKKLPFVLPTYQYLPWQVSLS